MDRLMRLGSEIWVSRVIKGCDGWTVESHRPLALVKLFRDKPDELYRRRGMPIWITYADAVVFSWVE